MCPDLRVEWPPSCHGAGFSPEGRHLLQVCWRASLGSGLETGSQGCTVERGSEKHMELVFRENDKNEAHV